MARTPEILSREKSRARVNCDASRRRWSPCSWPEGEGARLRALVNPIDGQQSGDFVSGQGKTKEAENLFHCAVLGREKGLASDFPNTLQTINDFKQPIRDMGIA